MAKPIAASAPAKVNVYKTKTCPNTSSNRIENIAKLKLTANNINSIETRIIIMFFLVIKIPNIPKKNITKEKNSKKKILKLVIFLLFLKNTFKTMSLKGWNNHS
jgi:hypothetical protein